jgi:hypothetical protein
MHSAITAEQRAHLEALPNGEERFFYLADEIFEEVGEAFQQEMDKSWDSIHRCLTQSPPGAEMIYSEDGTYPLKLAILGGKDLSDDPSYIVTLIEPHQVPDLAQAMAGISRERFTELYWHHCRDYAPEFGEQDLEYSLEYFEYLRDFLARIAPTGRAVVFFADQ